MNLYTEQSVHEVKSGCSRANSDDGAKSLTHQFFPCEGKSPSYEGRYASSCSGIADLVGMDMGVVGGGQGGTVEPIVQAGGT